MNSINASILQLKPPYYIKALHEKRRWVDETSDRSGNAKSGPVTEWSKIFEFQLSSKDNGTLIDVSIDSPSDLLIDKKKKLKKIIWSKFIGDLLIYLGKELTLEEKKRYYSNEYFRNEEYYFLGNALIHLVLLSLIFIFNLFNQGIIIIIGALFFLYQSIQSLREYYQVIVFKREIR